MRIAILGCGSIGRRHIRNLVALGYDDLIAFDPILAARQQAADECGIAVADDLSSVWNTHPTAVVIAAPSDQHTPLGLEAAHQNCHLFIEKPIAHTLAGLDTLMAEVERRNLVTMVGCNMRFHHGPATIKKLIGNGTIGTVIAARLQTGSYLPRWRPWQDYRQSYSASLESGGVVLDCIHEIDLALWYFGPARLVGSLVLPAQSIDLQTDGVAEIILQHVSGVASNVHLNFVQRDYRRTCQVIGSEGTLYWDFSARQVTHYGADGQQHASWPEPTEWEVNQMYKDEMAHFLDAVLRSTTTENPLAGGRSALEIALAVRQNDELQNGASAP